MDPKIILIILVALVMGWFAYGIITNLRKGDRLVRWLRIGLPAVGEKTTFRWLGSSVAEMVINKAKRPLRNLTTLLVFVPRDVPWMWAWARLRGRRDTVVFRAQLNSAPRLDLELADPRSWTGRGVIRQLSDRGWESRPYDGLQLMAPRGHLDLAAGLLDQLAGPKGELTPSYWRFGLRRESPHLELHLALPDIRRVEAAQFFAALKKLAGAICE